MSTVKPWVVLNVACTAILDYCDTEAEAVESAKRFGSASFAYELSEAERTGMALTTAARISITLPIDHLGRRKDDPLEALIPFDGAASLHMIRATELVTGERPYDDQGHPTTETGIVNVAPWLRASLRRWAMKHEQ